MEQFWHGHFNTYIGKQKYCCFLLTINLFYSEVELKMTEINTNFKINHPTGPGPFMSYDSDEESFVVLGKSLINDIDYNSTEADSPNGNKTCEEAKRIIDEEIRKLSLNSKGESTSDRNPSKQNPFQQLNSSNSGPSTSNVPSIQKKSSVFSDMESSFKKSILSELESFAKQKDVSEVKINGGQIWSTSEQVPISNEARQEGKPLNGFETSLSFDAAEVGMKRLIYIIYSAFFSVFATFPYKFIFIS